MSGKRKAKETKAAAQKKQKEEAAMLTSANSSSSAARMDVSEDTSGFEFKRLLVNTPVENLAYKKPRGVVYFVDRTDKVKDVFKGLVNQGFLSVPVLQKTKNRWYGFIDLGDIVDFYVQSFGDILGKEGVEFWEKIAEREGFLDKTVDEIMESPRTRDNPFHPVRVGYSLFSAVEALAREPRLHRVPVIDAERNMKSVLSQSQVVEFVHENINLIGNLKDKKVGTMKNVYKDVKSIDEKTPAIKGFQLMQETGFGGIAVLDENGRVVDNLSLRDLKVIRFENQLIHRLFYPVKDFLRILEEERNMGGVPDNRPLIRKIVRENDTLEHVIKILVTYKVHRVYLVNDDDKPLGVVSLKDVLLELISANA
jgi:CBS domain-containing protein